MNDLEYIIKKSIKELYNQDKILFNNNISEMCLVYNFAKYFEKNLINTKWSEYNIDIEYNRNCNKLKSLEFQKSNFPDLILHKRGSNNFNELVIEFKKWNNRQNKTLERDRKKLKGFMREYNYKRAVLIIFDKQDYNKVIYEFQK